MLKERAEQTGLPVGQVLREQSREMRLRRVLWTGVGFALAAFLGVGYVSIRSFEQLADSFILGIWPFYALAVGAVYTLRRRRPDLERPYRTVGYPVVPFVFLAASLAILGNALVQRISMKAVRIVATTSATMSGARSISMSISNGSAVPGKLPKWCCASRDHSIVLRCARFEHPDRCNYMARGNLARTVATMVAVIAVSWVRMLMLTGRLPIRREITTEYDEALRASRDAERDAQDALARAAVQQQLDIAKANEVLLSHQRGGRYGISDWQSERKRAQRTVQQAQGEAGEAASARLDRELASSSVRRDWRDKRLEVERLRLLIDSFKEPSA